MRFEDKRILRKALQELALVNDGLNQFEFKRAQDRAKTAQFYLSRLADNVYLNSATEEEKPDPYVLRA